MNERDEDLMLEYYSTKDEQIFTKLFERYKIPVLNFALRILGNRADAEDVTGEVFFSLFSKDGAYKPEARFSTWLFTLARNAALSRIRRRNNIFFLWTRSEDGQSEMLMDIPDESSVPADEVDKKEKTQMVKQALARLPINQREAIVLREYQQFSYMEISRILDCSINNVKVLIFRAREALKQELSKVIGDDGHE